MRILGWKRNEDIVPIPVEPKSYFSITKAVLCIDCETVFSREVHKSCPVCAGHSAYIIGLALKTNDPREYYKMKKE